MGPGGAGRSRTGGWGRRVVRGCRQGQWGAGGAGRGTLGWSGVEDEDSGGWGTRAEGLKVRGPPSLLFSLLSQPSPLQLPAASGGGGNLRQGRGAGNRGWLGLGGSVPGRSPAHMAPPRLPARPRLCVGQQVPGLPGRASRSPASLACCPGTPEGRFCPVFGAGTSEESPLRLPSLLGT